MRTQVKLQNSAWLLFAIALIASAVASAELRTDVLDERGDRTLVISERNLGPSLVAHYSRSGAYKVRLDPVTRQIASQEYSLDKNTLRIDAQSGRLVYRRLDGSSILRMTFELNAVRQRYDLVSITKEPLRPMFNESDGDVFNLGNADTTSLPSTPTSEPCPKQDPLVQATQSLTTKVLTGSLGEAKLIECKRKTAEEVSTIVSNISGNNDPKRFIGCVSKINSAIGVSLREIFSAKNQNVVACYDASRSATIERKIFLGKDFETAADLNSKTKILFHESLHQAIGVDEQLVQAYSECCTDGTEQTKSCGQLTQFYALKKLFSSHKDGSIANYQYDGIDEVFHQIAKSPMSQSEKEKLTLALRDSYIQSLQKFWTVKTKDRVGLVAELNANLVKLCRTKLPECDKFSSALNAENMDVTHVDNLKGSETSFAVLTAQREMRDNIGKTPAVAATTQGPPVPQNLEVRPPDANRLARVRDQMEEYSKPYRALTEQLGTATRSIVANIAPVSPAVASTRRTATTSRTSGASTRTATIPASFTATVTSVKNEEFQIQMPDKTMASGWVPFTKDGYGTPQIKLTPPTGQSIGAGTLAQSETGETTRARKGSVPTRIPRESTTAATGGGGQAQASTAGGGGATGGGGSSPTVTRAPSGGAGAQLDFSTARLREISEIKLQLVRSAKPEEAIKARIPDLRRLSIQVYYNGEPYPADLQNPETTLDLNRYRGNR